MLVAMLGALLNDILSWPWGHGSGITHPKACMSSLTPSGLQKLAVSTNITDNFVCHLDR